MMGRIRRLEAQNSAVRKNDIRLGTLVVTADPDYGRIGLENVKTKEKVFVGDPADAVFSYSGPLESGSTSPPHIMRQASVAREIVVSCLPANVSDADMEFQIDFNDGEVILEVTLPAGDDLIVRGITLPIGINQRIYVTCTTTNGTDAPAVDVSVFVRFGTTTAKTITETDA